jgi:protein AroM
MDRTVHQFRPGFEPIATPRRIAFVTLGQSPRVDLVPEILSSLDSPVQPLEYGLLDDVNAKELRAAEPRPGEPAFLTRLRDGNHVELSVEWTHERFRDVYDRIKQRGSDLVVLTLASCGQDFRPDGATIQSDKVVERAIDALSNADLHLGIVVPLDGLIRDHQMLGGPWERTSVAAARPGDFDALSRAVSEMTDCDILVLHSMGYTNADRDEVRRLAQKPVIMNRRLVANAIKRALVQLDEEDHAIGASSLSNRLRSLSDRERQTMYFVAEGLSNKEIARRLNISYRTVEIHRPRMMEKMAFRSISDLVRVVDMVSDF